MLFIDLDYSEPKQPKINRTKQPSTITPKDHRPVNMSVGTNLTSLLNTPITINCLASGLPAPTIKWMKDGKDIDVADGYKINADGSLLIENAKAENSGRYTCEAENVEGQDKESSTVNVIGNLKINTL